MVAAGAAGLVSVGGEAFARGRRRGKSADVIEVRARAGDVHGTLRFHGKRYPCMVGHYGVTADKRESDGCTPAGRFPLREVRYRPDRLDAAPKSGLPVFPAKQNDGWCDDPEDPNYNRVVSRPYQTDTEQMWRDDHLYDVLAVIGYNDDPPRPGRGSAIFLHIMRPPTDDHQWTAGCVSLKKEDLLEVLSQCTVATEIDIRAT
jgi:L,D-peptidoglycan transpeptidase YkuD (ErfK/YbiS/YcfS/YnhG family)